jgi:uncharacterized membrane protein YvbJ
MFCPNCGHKAEGVEKFCSQCGTPLEGGAAVKKQSRQEGGKAMAAKRISIRYKGSGGDLLGRFILWAILTAITLGIYAPWAANNFYRYIIEHIELEIPA